jgi:signal transduction histidine kinase
MMQTSLYGVSVDSIAEHFDVSRRTAERMLAAVRSRAPDIEHQLRNGQKFWRLPRSSSSVPDELPVELEGLSQRVTELEEEIVERKKHVQTQQSIVDDVLAASAVGVLVLDVDFQVIWVNDALLKYFGLERGAIVGQDKRTLIQKGIREIFEESAEFESRVLATYDDNNYIEHFECHVLPRPGRAERWLEHWSQPIDDGPHAGGRIEHYVDITSRVRDRELNRRERWSLPARSAHLQQQKTARKLAAQSLDHIRAPLDAIAECAREAVECGEDDRGDALKKVLELAESAREALQQTFGRLAEPELKIEPTRLRSLMQDLAERMRPHMAERNVGVRLELTPMANELVLQIDPEFVRWTLFEFMCYALRAMGDGDGSIVLMAEVVAAGRHVWIAVKDTGPGIPEGEREFVFNPFYTTHEGAAGVGLMKALHVVRQHGGQIGIEDNDEEGAIFYMELPIVPAASS